jgi:3-dehydroquinate dehydratase II
LRSSARAAENQMAKPVHVLNGPNLNLLGSREVEIYGSGTLADIEKRCHAVAERLGMTIVFAQTNGEGELVSMVQRAGRESSGVVLNAAAYTHTSLALHDALKMLSVPLVEIHLSNVYKREPIRHKSFVSALATGVICGFGPLGYELALEAIAPLVAAAAP